jgi:imidazole glycerol phosphate synthase glutamine amidotransferase subunit
VKRVSICDYGAGNVRSVAAAFSRLGAAIVDDHTGADLTVLPGVGSAASAMAGLRARCLDRALRQRFESGRPILGICLGLQLALDETEEDGGVVGLGFLPGRAVQLRVGRVPRIGWAVVEPECEAYYFAHSFAAETPKATSTSEGLVAAAEHGSFLGVQFHPEKSGAAGTRYLERCLSRA